MFLWVRLVITTLEERCSLLELREAVNLLPEGLNAAWVLLKDAIFKH